MSSLLKSRRPCSDLGRHGLTFGRIGGAGYDGLSHRRSSIAAAGSLPERCLASDLDPGWAANLVPKHGRPLLSLLGWQDGDAMGVRIEANIWDELRIDHNEDENPILQAIVLAKLRNTSLQQAFVLVMQAAWTAHFYPAEAENAAIVAFAVYEMHEAIRFEEDLDDDPAGYWLR